MQQLSKNAKFCLTTPVCGSHDRHVAPHWATGVRSPIRLQATPDAPCVFFIVVASVHPYSAALIRTESMVALAGLTSVRPVSCNAGTSNPVRVTTNQEVRSSGGGIRLPLQEIDACQRSLPILARNLPGFFWPFAAQTCATNHTVSTSPHLMNAQPADCWPVISCSALPDVFPQGRC